MAAPKRSFARAVPAPMPVLENRRDVRYLGAAHAYAIGLKAGVCPCTWPGGAGDLVDPNYAALAEDDPGPAHLTACPFSDPDFGGF